MILTDRREEVKEKSNIHRGRFCVWIYLTNTVQGNTQLTRIHGLHRKKKLKKKKSNPKQLFVNLSLLHV